MRSPAPLLLALGLCLPSACSPPSDEAARSSRTRSPADAAPAIADAGDAPVAAAAPARRERPLPAFSGTTLDGRQLAISSLIGRRLLLFFFEPGAPEAEPAAEAVARIAPLRAEHNFRIVGIATGASRTAARELVARHGLDFRILDDSSRAIARRLGLRAPVLFLTVDAEGYMISALGRFPPDAPDPAGVVETSLRETLRLPAGEEPLAPLLGERPAAPDFRAPRPGGGEPFELSALRGRPVVLIFFLHTCPHCHSALRTLQKTLSGIPEDARPELVGVSLVNAPSKVRASLEQEGLGDFEVLFDPDKAIATAYGGIWSVPVLFGIDAQGGIAWRMQGWRDDRDPPLLRMRLARLAGQPVPMLLHPTGYSGNEFCVTCHERQHETWLLTRHATAFQTLVRHGAERDAECVSCHVVGYGERGGYSLAAPAPHLEDVGCESCHGRGGPHLSPSDGGYEAACAACHDEKHSLNFDYAEFLPRVSHAANAQLTGLSLAEKRALLRERARPRENLLPTAASYVGSEACRSCHVAEHATWSESPHAAALATLAKRDEADNAKCLACHTTGYRKSGGFPAGGTAGDHPDLSGVGCESCHGPGGDHVGADAPKTGTIVSLGDKCDSCVILQICGTCHDDANDPGFEFEVQEKIERQRHGTIEPGTGGGAGREARAAPDGQDGATALRPGRLGRLLDALDALDARG